MANRPLRSYQFGPFRVDANDRLLYRDGEVVALPPKVFDTLLLLVTNSGHVLPKHEMIEQLWPALSGEANFASMVGPAAKRR